MNVSDIVALAHAGFTVEQITKLATAPEPKPNTEANPTPVPAPAPVNNPNPTPAPAPNPVPAPAPDMNDSITNNAVVNKLDDFMKMIMANNILNSNQPKPVTADDVIASIINPTHKED